MLLTGNQILLLRDFGFTEETQSFGLWSRRNNGGIEYIDLREVTPTTFSVHGEEFDEGPNEILQRLLNTF